MQCETTTHPHTHRHTDTQTRPYFIYGLHGTFSVSVIHIPLLCVCVCVRVRVHVYVCVCVYILWHHFGCLGGCSRAILEWGPLYIEALSWPSQTRPNSGSKSRWFPPQSTYVIFRLPGRVECTVDNKLIYSWSADYYLFLTKQPIDWSKSWLNFSQPRSLVFYSSSPDNVAVKENTRLLTIVNL